MGPDDITLIIRYFKQKENHYAMRGFYEKTFNGAADDEKHATRQQFLDDLQAKINGIRAENEPAIALIKEDTKVYIEKWYKIIPKVFKLGE